MLQHQLYQAPAAYDDGSVVITVEEPDPQDSADREQEAERKRRWWTSAMGVFELNKRPGQPGRQSNADPAADSKTKLPTYRWVTLG